MMRPFLIVLFLLTLIKLPAQSPDQLRSQLRASYAAGRMNEWEGLIRQLEKGYETSRNILWLEELAWAEYGYTAYLLHARQEKKAEQYLKSALAHAELLLELRPGSGGYLALKSSLTAFRISLRPLSAPFLGPRSARLMDEAMAADATDPRVLTEKGLARFYAPSWAGGNPEEAVKLFRTAASRVPTSNEFLRKSWYYLHLMVSLGQSLQKTNRNAEAVTLYQNLLKEEPSFEWVKNELLPQAMSSLKNQKSGT
ncbi:MAG: hypothetical protein ACP5O2_10135 [Bacteroidales bacterium]